MVLDYLELVFENTEVMKLETKTKAMETM